MKGKGDAGLKLILATGAVGTLLLAQGCVATRDWVREHVEPISGRVTQGENRLGQAEAKIGQAETQIGSLGGRLSGAEGKLGQFEGRLGQTDAKAEKALSALSNLKLERRFVIDMKEGANFAFNSANLPAQVRKEIDGFLSDLKGDPAGMDGTLFLIAGHTDSAGSEDYNYELGKKRADAVSRYLITQKKLDPLRVHSVSYGETAPVTENKTARARAKNRRVEILVYREGITSSATAAAPQPEQRSSQPEQQSRTIPEGRLSQR
jgi:outer membrane protein OmpA-like peptidoglycan-associated protein